MSFLEPLPFNDCQFGLRNVSFLLSMKIHLDINFVSKSPMCCFFKECVSGSFLATCLILDCNCAVFSCLDTQKVENKSGILFYFLQKQLFWNKMPKMQAIAVCAMSQKSLVRIFKPGCLVQKNLFENSRSTLKLVMSMRNTLLHYNQPINTVFIRWVGYMDSFLWKWQWSPFTKSIP